LLDEFLLYSLRRSYATHLKFVICSIYFKNLLITSHPSQPVLMAYRKKRIFQENKTKPNPQYTRAWQTNITLWPSCSPTLSSSGIHFISTNYFLHSVLTLILRLPSLFCSKSISHVCSIPYPPQISKFLSSQIHCPLKFFLNSGLPNFLL